MPVRSTKLALTCTVCGKYFTRNPSNMKNGASFCSKKCSGIGRNKRQPKIKTYDDLIEVMLSKVDKTPGQGPNGDCWEWMGERSTAGYGIQWIFEERKRKGAHRLLFEYFNKTTLMTEDFVCHSCDNPPCCNPTHLFKGTLQDNTTDKVNKGRQRRGESIPWSKLTEEQVYTIKFLSPNRTHSSMAKQYGVTRKAISNILSGLTWKHIVEVGIEDVI